MANSQTFTLNIKALFDASDVKAKVGDIQSTLSKLKLPDKLATDLNSSFTNVNKALDDFISKTEKGVKTKADATGITKSFDAVTKELTKLDNLMIKVKGQLGEGADLSKIIKIDDKTRSELDQLENKIKAIQTELANINTSKLSQLESLLSKIKSGSGAQKQGQAALELFKQGDVEGAIQSLNKIIKKLEEYKKAHTDAKTGATDKDLTNVSNSLEQLTKMRTEIVNAQTESANKITEINNLSTEAAQKLASAQNEVINKVNDSSTALSNMQRSAVGAGQGINDLTTRQAQFVKEIDQVKSRIQYFFGISNAINLVKRAIRGAVETVKDLDKAMTETAVVTKNTVSDMWAKLPEYTKRANDLGVSTLEAYQAATLYYQQGLNDEQAGALSVETLKMARIAGLDAADATDRMTNALRGFNMELNAVNAQKVDDVYSQLAAMSASNVDEISTAMTKVASLAHNANMEFETTAAFLAQIIETTRESAETAGTALKTVVARFSEVKKLYSEDQLKGTDEEGQGIDVNKISTALRTAGIDLNKYFLGEVGLDDIFMELASKWDSLTSVQQRYIATQAAGSRQQSRFIAMMQDYARTQELVSAAYNANGASAKQFEKTQDSLQSKLARLKNAWNEFIMGLANNAVIKGVVDLLTLLLNTVNSLTSAFGSVASGFLKFIIAAAGFIGLKNAIGPGGIVNRAIGGVLSNNPISNKIRASLGQGTFDEATDSFTPYTPEQMGTRTRFFGTGGLFSDLGTNISKFKANSFDPREIARNQQLAAAWAASPAGRIGQATGQSAPQLPLTAPKTLFGALGNRFIGTKVGSGMQGALSKLPGIGSAFTGAAAGAATLGVALAGVAATAFLVYKAWQASPQGQLKNAQKQAEKAREESEKAQKELKSLTSLQDTYKEKTEAIDNATTVQDRKQAIEDRNQALLDAIKEDGTLAQYVITEQVDNEIVLRVDEAGLAKAAEEATKIAEQAAIKSYFKESTVGVKEASVAKNSLEKILTGTGLFDASYIAGKSAEEIYQLILQNSGSLSQEQLSKAAEYYGSYNASIGSAEQQARLAYGKSLASVGASDELTNALIPVLSKMWIDTGKEISTTQLKNLTTSSGALSIASAINGEGKLPEITLSDDIINDRGKLLESLGISESALESFATALGVSTKDIYAQIKASAKQQKEIQKQNQATIFESALKSGIKIDKDTFTDVKSLEPQIAAQIAEISNVAQKAMSEEGFKSLMEQMISGSLNTNQLQEIQSFYNNFNLDNPIQAFHQLKQAQDEVASRADNDPFKGMLASIDEANKKIFDTGNLVQTFITSVNYDSLTDSLEKFIDENGRITSNNIDELADSCSELQILLEDTTVTAQGLAEAFTLLETGKLAFDAITSSILEALSAGTSFEGLIDNVNKWINDFNQGTDLKVGTEHITSTLDDLFKYVDNWEFGNEPTENIYNHIFGTDKNKDPYKDLISQYGTNFTGLENTIKGDIERVKGWAENEGLGGIQEALRKGVTGLSQIEGENGLFFDWNLDDFSSTSKAINQVADALGIGQEAAEAFIMSWQTHMPALRTEWNNLQFKEAMDAYVKDLGNGSVVTQQELDGLAEKYGKDVDEIINKINELRAAADKPAIVKVNWQDEKGYNLSGKDLINQFNETTGTDTREVARRRGEAPAIKDDYSNLLNSIQDVSREVTTQIGTTFDTIDFDTLHNHLVDAFKLTPQQATEVANHIAEQTGKSFSKEIEVPFVADNGSIQTQTEVITSNTAEGLEAGVNAALEAANVALVAQKLAELDLSSVGDKLGQSIELGGKAGVNAVQTAIDNLNTDVTVYITYEETNSPPQLATGGMVSKYITRASGGIVDSYANGSENFHVGAGTALTGEEGPELVWNKDKGYAYVTGQEGPEFANLQPGDRIFNASETKRIFANSRANGGLIDSFASGGWKPPASTSKSGGGGGGGKGGGGGGSDKTPEEWKNDLDWLYNLMEDIAELERDQKAIEEQYEDLLQDQTKTGNDLYKLLVQQLGNLYTQLEHQSFALEKREQEMREFMDVTNDKDEYLWYNWQDRTIEIDWDAIDQITDEEEYKHVKELIDEAEEIQDKIDDADDAIMDITNQIQELENIWRDTFTDFEKRVYDAIVKSYQQVIDKYSELNETLNDSNSKILESLQKEIDLQRQIRDNTKTEEEISDEEARLAYLRRDTSGGNEVEAKGLEKDLEEKRQNYTDSLVDQAINRLQEDNDLASQQREKQIEIMQAQLDYQSENGEFNDYVRELLDAAIDEDGKLLNESNLVELLKEQENWDAMSVVSKQVWEEELNNTFKEVVAFLLKQNSEQNGTFYTALTEAIKGVSSVIGSYSQAMVKIGNTISSIGSSGGYSGSPGGGPSGEQKQQQSSFLNKIGTTVTKNFQNAIQKPVSGGCFAPGTKILMADNSIQNIELIQIGDIVIAYNELTKKFVPKKVTKSYIHYNTPAMVKLTFVDNSILELTPGHPLYSTCGWKSLDIENSLYEHGTITTLLHIGDEIIGINGNKIIKSIEWLNINTNYNSYNIEVEDCHTFLANGLVAHNMKVQHYATGGLADSTGLAWLDGTPKEPEYVLNARQTDAFLKLAEVLPSMMGSSNFGTSNTFGSSIFNLSINLDSVSPDYDVDRMVSLVKEKLYDSGSYRNVNSLSFIR